MASILHSIIPPRLDPLRATEAGKARPRRGTGQQILGPAFPEAVLFLCLLALPRGPEPPQQAETATGVLSPAQRVGDLQRDVQAVLQLIGAGSLAVEVLFRAVCPASLDLCGDLGSLRACFRLIGSSFCRLDPLREKARGSLNSSRHPLNGAATPFAMEC